MSNVQSLEKIVNNLRLIQSEQQLEALWTELENVQQPTVISFANAHAVNIALENTDFLSDLVNSDILFRDGSGLSLLLQIIGTPPGINMNGTDLIPKIISRLNTKSYAIYGTQEPWLSKSIEKLSSQIRIIDSLDGFKSDDVYLSQASASKPDIIILAMGMPKQERVALLLKHKLHHPCLIINGGAILDFLSERFPRAPAWMRKIGCEWLYRLFLEPNRLFKRYIVGNVVFIVRALRYKREKSKS